MLHEVGSCHKLQSLPHEGGEDYLQPRHMGNGPPPTQTGHRQTHSASAIENQKA